MNDEAYLQQLSQRLYNLRKILQVYVEHFQPYHDDKVMYRYYTSEVEKFYELKKDERYNAFKFRKIFPVKNIIIGETRENSIEKGLRTVNDLNSVLAEVERKRTLSVEAYKPKSGFDEDSRELEEFLLSIEKDSLTKGRRRQTIAHPEPSMRVAEFSGLELYSDNTIMIDGKTAKYQGQPVVLRLQLSTLCEMLMNRNGRFVNYDDITETLSPGKQMKKSTLGEAVRSLRRELEKLRIYNVVFDIKNQEESGYRIVKIG